MSTNYWIHIIIFVAVFIITGIVLSRRARKKIHKTSGNEYKEIQAEVFEIDNLKRQTKDKKIIATEKEKTQEEFKRKAANDWVKIRAKMKASYYEMKSPYEILGVHENDSIETIMKVHSKLIEIYNPDNYETADDRSMEQKHRITTQINAAYNWILKHHRKK